MTVIKAGTNIEIFSSGLLETEFVGIYEVNKDFDTSNAHHATIKKYGDKANPHHFIGELTKNNTLKLKKHSVLYLYRNNSIPPEYNE